jgi:4-hydroxy-tetrahydrodipicolinate reductase
MRIALIGYGKMGRLIHELCRKQGIEVVSIIDPMAEGATSKSIDEDSMVGVDVCIDFSHPQQVLANARAAAGFGKDIVVGTTGWYEMTEEMEKIAEDNGTGIIWSGNFSLGMNIFLRIIKDASRIAGRFDEYDVFAEEHHHRMKADAPSGTAMMIGSVIMDAIPRKKKIVYDRPTGKLASDELHFASLRGGHVPGTHAVFFDSAADTIELKHTARSREGFAEGAIAAAKWIKGRKGFYAIDDMMDSIIG